jgi:hypothetical protein|tara:strand:+ start:7433 stop:7678 length:246 start_codon:yes stop_codon:yes gene_type:complete
MKELDHLYQQCRDKVRYGNLWSSFDVSELIEYSRIKAKRGGVLLQTDFLSDKQKIESSIDDLLDAANLCIMAAKRIEELNG